MTCKRRIPMAVPNLRGNELKYLSGCIESGWISWRGEFVHMFEQNFADFCGVRFASSCCNGTAALHLALLALGVTEGDEVIVPSMTFAATANAVKHCGATPILADIDRKTWNITADEIEKRVTPRTRAIIVVHLFGNPCGMDEILHLADERKLFIVEDCAEAHGAEYKGKKVGGFGDIGCFSFYANKIITTGEGGMCVCDDEKLIQRINLIKNHGMTEIKQYWHEIVGYNYRMTNLQAAVGQAQLERISEFIEKRAKLVALYKELLCEAQGIEFQAPTACSTPIFWVFPIVLSGKFSLSRDMLSQRLEENGVETRKMFYPLNEMPPFYSSQKYPVSKHIFDNGLVLPLYDDLGEDDIEFICRIVRRA